MKSYFLSPAVQIEILPQIEGYALDCRLLFMGDHLRQLVRTHKEIIHRFHSFQNADRLFTNLTTSAEIGQFYEVSKNNGVVGLSLHPEIFEKQGPIEFLNILLEIRKNGDAFKIPFSLEKLPALGQVLPLLRSGCSGDVLWNSLQSQLKQDDISWIHEFTDLLEKQQCFTISDKRENHFKRCKDYPRVTFLGHSSLLFQSDQAAVVTDPCLRMDFGLPKEALDVAKLAPLALCLSHSHWDHCNLDSLLWFDKNLPVVVPKIHRATAFNPPIVNVLRMIGFTDIREVTSWESVRFHDIEIFTAPFHGEQDEPGEGIDHFTYVIKSDGLCVYGGADSYQDTFGDMRAVLKRIREEHHPDLAFLPVSKMVYSYEYGGVNGFCRYIDNKLVNHTFQYTASPDDAAEWVEILQPRWVSPYATFNFSPWSTPGEVAKIAKSLRSRKLGNLLYPVRPMCSISSRHLLQTTLTENIRRRILILWFELGGTLKFMDRKMHHSRIYRYLRYRIMDFLKPKTKHHAL